MSEFDKRWQIGARRARENQPTNEAQAPFIFAARVVALARTATTPVVSLEQIWMRFALRALACLSVALILAISYEDRGLSDHESLLPEVEFTPTQSPWMP